MDWAEKIETGEQERFARQAARVADIQAARSQRWGSGRALHRKQVAAAQGTLEVLDGLPGFAAHGLFATPHVYEAQVRLSNGGLDCVADAVPDIRGFALRVLGVEGESVLGGPARTQDFTFINQDAFAFARSDEFVDMVAAAADGHGALLRFLVRRYGVAGGLRRMARMARTLGRPFGGFATATLCSALPIACGPYAVRVRLLPSSTNGSSAVAVRRDWAADFGRRLRAQPLHWDLQLQFWAHESITPIEDASVNWPTPFSTVARLMLPVQDIEAPAGQALGREVDAVGFDPWHALAEHRPLGEVQRARKAAYLASRQQRGAA